ncbi:hypothetical protein HMPREF9303_0632 [Prevotella denticola CRIS 18C-A]|uniref:Uncharacterized protein n=1 Tax=Prevotella denticola CRIS 18C-A TaxID=944557 RepID=F0H8F7_9BACT|nr:hypothetical protein HMPREF9303_0632 [Prevotella denticola CRIS 18C-A]
MIVRFSVWAQEEQTIYLNPSDKSRSPCLKEIRRTKICLFFSFLKKPMGLEVV